MPLNVHAAAGRLLAVEPDASQAEALRRFVREGLRGADLVIVSSAFAAVVAINRQIPDVVLFSESIVDKHRDRVLDHLRSTIRPAVPQRLTLPSLRDCDRVALAGQITTLVTKAQELRPREAGSTPAASRTATSTPAPSAPPPVARSVSAPSAATQPVAAPSITKPPVVLPSVPPLPVWPPPHGTWSRHPRSPRDLEALKRAAPTSKLDPESLSLEEPPSMLSEPIRPPTRDPGSELETPTMLDGPSLRELESIVSDLRVDPLSTEVSSHPVKEAGPAKTEADTREQVEPQPIEIPNDSQPSHAEAIDAEVHEAEIALVQAMADAKLAEELDRVRANADRTLALELDRTKAEADSVLEAQLAHAQAEAEAQARRAAEQQAALAAEEVARVKKETEARLSSEAARLKQETDARLASEAARAAEEVARVKAETDARLAAELARVREEADARLQAQMERLRQEAEEARRVHEEAAAREARRLAEEAAAKALDAEVTRARDEVEAQLQDEMEQLRQEMAAARLAHERDQLQAEKARDAATRDARDMAQKAAAATLEAEVKRAREEADARLKVELEQIRKDAETARLAQERAQKDAEDARARAAHKAQRAAQESAARALEAEVARVRAEAESRLRQELERLRIEAVKAQEKSHLEAAHLQEQTQFDIEMLREGAALEARRAAEGVAARALEEEVSRVRAEADARLKAELARVRAETDRMRQSQRETEALRDSAAAQALEAEVARVRHEANWRLEQEIALVKQEAVVARRQLEDEKRHRDVQREQQEAQWRLAAEQETARAFEAGAARVRAEAEARLREETARARQEANSRFETEVAAIKAEAEHRRSHELEEVRAQVLRLRTDAAKQARAAAEQAATAKVARAKALPPKTPAVRDLGQHWSDTLVADDRQLLRSFEPVPSHRNTWLIAAFVILIAIAGSLYEFDLIPFGTWSKGPSAPVVNQEEEQTTEPAAPLVDSTASPGGAAAGPAGELQVESTPPGARVQLDGRETGFTPVTLKDVPAGRHSLVLEGQGGTVRRTVRVQGGERTVARYEIGAGFLSVFSRIPVEIYNGSSKLGVSGDKSIQLAPGQYKVSLVNTHFHFKADADITIRPGEVTTHTVQLPKGQLVVNTTRGADILIDGDHVGTAPVAPISVPIGTREVTVRHPRLGERRQAVEVGGDKAVELTVVFEASSAPRSQPRPAPLSTPPDRRSR